MTVTEQLPGGVSYYIEETSSGWMLVMENAHCTFSQVFPSRSAARQRVMTSASTLESLTRQHLQRHPA